MGSDKLCLIIKTETESCWKDVMKSKGFRVNMDKTKAMCCKVKDGQADITGKWLCAVCKRGVRVNSINGTVCKHWIQMRCIDSRGVSMLRDK